MAKNNFKKFNEKENVEVKETAVVEEKKDKLGVVNCDLLNVRKEASTDSEPATTITKGTEVKILGDEKEFYEITTGSGVKGFCMKTFIDIK